MNINGIIVGAATFLIIGICHPLVIKAEYYIGKKSWWGFLAGGIVLAAVSLMIRDNTLSTIVGAGAFSFFWGNRGSDCSRETGAQGMVPRESQAA